MLQEGRDPSAALFFISCIPSRTTLKIESKFILLALVVNRPDNSDSEEEIDSIIEFLLSNYVSLFDSMPSYIKQEEILRNKIGTILESAEAESLTDKARFEQASRYYAAYANRSWEFASCSKSKQEERLEELGDMLVELCSCLK